MQLHDELIPPLGLVCLVVVLGAVRRVVVLGAMGTGNWVPIRIELPIIGHYDLTLIFRNLISNDTNIFRKFSYRPV